MSVDIRVQKHRPSKLNLSESNSTNSDLALRIISPGIPQLNKEMILTIKILKQIELQQKSLIAGRSKQSDENDEEAEAEEEAEVGEEKEKEEEVEEKEGKYEKNVDSIDSKNVDLLINPNKRLKRNFIPKPLNIDFNKKLKFLPSSYPYTSIGPYFPNVIPSFYKPQTQYNGHYRRSVGFHPNIRRAYPHTSVGLNFPSREFGISGRDFSRDNTTREYIENRFAPTNTRCLNTSVTDVYAADFIKTAPLSAQPLSSQQEIKKVTRMSDEDYVYENDDDKTPITDEEIREMEQKHHQGNSHKSGEIFGSINLMNESVFNFKIFTKDRENDEENISAKMDKGTQIDQDNKNQIKHEDGIQNIDDTTNEKNQFNENYIDKQDENRSNDGKENITLDDESLLRLSEQKAKFMKICETSWDLFAKKMTKR